MIIANILFFLLGLVLLVKGSDFFVKSAASIAEKFGVSEFIIGLTLVAFATSLPELSSAIVASLRNDSAFVIGNVVGANIANIGLIVGIGAIIAVIKTKEEMFRRDGYIMLMAGILLFVIVHDGIISRLEGGLFLLVYFSYMTFLFTTKEKYRGKYHFKEFVKFFFSFQYIITLKNGIIKKLNHSSQGKQVKELFKEGIIKDILIMALSGVVIAYGADFLVRSASYFAFFFKIPETVISASIVSIGTTMPELSVTVSAARKGFGNIIVGNAVGSVIANTFLIIGVAGMLNPIKVLEVTIFFNVPFMLMMMVLLLVFIKSHWEIRRYEGVTFLLMYVFFVFMLFWLI